MKTPAWLCEVRLSMGNWGKSGSRWRVCSLKWKGRYMQEPIDIPLLDSGMLPKLKPIRGSKRRRLWSDLQFQKFAVATQG